MYPIALWEEDALREFVPNAGGPVNVLAIPRAPTIPELAELAVRLTPRAERGGAMAGIEIRRFERADESRTFEHGSFDVVTLGGVTIGRASYGPGWIWSEHVGKPASEELCQVEHVGLVVSGRTGVRMANDCQSSR